MVAVSRAHGAVRVKDSKVADGPILSFSTQAWQQFALGVKAGEFRPSA